MACRKDNSSIFKAAIHGMIRQDIVVKAVVYSLDKLFFDPGYLTNLPGGIIADSGQSVFHWHIAEKQTVLPAIHV